GQIRNAALHATLLALETGQPLGDAHLEEAVQREFRKAGAAFPMRPVSSNGDQMARLRRFVDQVS
ncbi:MAG: hypothetical protein KDH89_11230, partial [Anaerolineae bacterium]|nr:hypothetical protein [Anaerolineae bacterium]